MTQGQEHSDQDLLNLLSTDNRKAMELIFRRYFDEMVKVVYRMIRNQEKAEDIVQDVFVKFWKQKENLKINSSLKAYLRRSCVNGCLDHIRKAKKFQTVNPETSLMRVASSQPDANKSMEVNELKILIQATIEDLPPKCKAVFTLSRQEQLSNKEIAERLGVTLKTVEAHITTALKRLRAVVKRH